MRSTFASAIHVVLLASILALLAGCSVLSRSNVFDVGCGRTIVDCTNRVSITEFRCPNTHFARLYLVFPKGTTIPQDLSGRVAIRLGDTVVYECRITSKTNRYTSSFRQKTGLDGYVVHDHNDILTPFLQKGQTYHIDVEFDTEPPPYLALYYHWLDWVWTL
jgi:hypothetical protein